MLCTARGNSVSFTEPALVGFSVFCGVDIAADSRENLKHPALIPLLLFSHFTHTSSECHITALGHSLSVDRRGDLLNCFHIFQEVSKSLDDPSHRDLTNCTLGRV